MKVWLSLILVLMLTGTSHAANVSTLLSAEEVSTGETAYSTAMGAKNADGYAAMLIDVTGTGSIDVTQQCSLDKTTWYDAINATGDTVGYVKHNVTSDTYVQFDPVLTPYIRFKVYGDSINTVTLKYIWKE